MAPKAVARTAPARQDLLGALECLALEAQAPATAARLLDETEAEPFTADVLDSLRGH